MKKVTFLRHGKIASAGRYVGSTDVSLSKEGETQIATMRPYFSENLYQSIYSSPLKRCVQTCESLNIEKRIFFDDRLREIDFGLWEGKSFDEIATTSPEEIEVWARGEEDFAFPEGESVSSFRNRITSFCATLRTTDSPTILIIAHGGVIRHMICNLLNLSFSHHICFNVQYGLFSTIFLFSDGGVLEELNQRGEHG